MTRKQGNKAKARPARLNAQLQSVVDRVNHQAKEASRSKKKPKQRSMRNALNHPAIYPLTHALHRSALITDCSFAGAKYNPRGTLSVGLTSGEAFILQATTEMCHQEYISVKPDWQSLGKSDQHNVVSPTVGYATGALGTIGAMANLKFPLAGQVGGSLLSTSAYEVAGGPIAGNVYCQGVGKSKLKKFHVRISQAATALECGFTIYVYRSDGVTSLAAYDSSNLNFVQETGTGIASLGTPLVTSHNCNRYWEGTFLALDTHPKQPISRSCLTGHLGPGDTTTSTAGIQIPCRSYALGRDDYADDQTVYGDLVIVVVPKASVSTALNVTVTAEVTANYYTPSMSIGRFSHANAPERNIDEQSTTAPAMVAAREHVTSKIKEMASFNKRPGTSNDHSTVEESVAEMVGGGLVGSQIGKMASNAFSATKGDIYDALQYGGAAFARSAGLLDMA